MYNLRLIDFEFAVKTNFTQLGCLWIYGTQCTDMIVRISRGWGEIYPEDEAMFDEESEEEESSDDQDEELDVELAESNLGAKHEDENSRNNRNRHSDR